MKKIVIYLLVFLLASIDLYAAEEKDAKAFDLGELVVTPTRTQEAVTNVASNISIITKQDIEKTGAKTIPDAIRQEPGIIVKDWSGTGKKVSVDIRGFGETGLLNVLVLVDGRRINDIDLGGTDWSQIPLESVERIEVIRGSASVLYGDNASGGVINIITKKGEKKPRINIKAQGGSYSTYGVSAETLGLLDKFDFYALAKYFNTKGYRENNDLAAKDIDLKAGYSLNEFINPRIQVVLHEDVYGLPGTLTDADIENLGRRGSKNTHDKADTKDYMIRIEQEGKVKVFGNDMGSLLLDSSYRTKRVYTDWVETGWMTKNNIRTVNFNPRYVLEKIIMNLKNKTVLGWDLQEAKDKIESGSVSSQKDLIDITKRSNGLYIFNELSPFERLSFAAGFRYENADYIFCQSQSTYRYIEKNDLARVGTIGATYSYMDNSSVFARFSQSFRMPAVDEYYSSWTGLNAALNPQRSNDYEVGIRHSFKDKITAGMTYYCMNIKDEIYYNPLTWANENYPKTKHKGVETQVKADINKRLSVFGTYSYTYAKLKSGPYNGNVIPGVPKNKASIGADVVLPYGFSTSLIGNYIGSQFLISDQANQVAKMKRYVTFDSKTRFQYKDFAVNFSVNNIFNKKYSEYGVTNAAGTSRNFYPAPERNYTLEGCLSF